MAEEGADWIDVGGESTRPGATPVCPRPRRSARVVPVIEGLRARLPAGVRISIDTYKAGTARGGARGGRDGRQRHLGRAARSGDPAASRPRPAAAIVLGHLRGAPATMMDDDRVSTTSSPRWAAELAERVAAARGAGCREIWADPGIGFGKRIEHNLALLRGAARAAARGSACRSWWASRARRSSAS